MKFQPTTRRSNISMPTCRPYHRHQDDWFIFTGVGTAGRTGHDYENHWDGDELVWRGRTNSRVDHPRTQSLLNPPGRVFVFTREQDRDPFTFAGCATVGSVEPTVPVTIRWRFASAGQDQINLPDEIRRLDGYREGAVRPVFVNAYERNQRARRACLEHYGTRCAVCRFDFRQVYGEIGDGFIHVHHLRELSSIGEEYQVDPIGDLRPVCPNCHAMLHTRVPALLIEELQAIIQAHRTATSG